MGPAALARVLLGHLRRPGDRDGDRVLAHSRGDDHDVRRGALPRRRGPPGRCSGRGGGIGKRPDWRCRMSTVTPRPRRRPRRETTHPTAAERIAAGRAARKEVPRFHHGILELPGERPDSVALLERQAEDRVPELIPIRYGRMLVSPFTFFRGAAAIMASDLAASRQTSLRAQLCGDAHLTNFGVFGSPERRLVFDIN